MVFKFIIISDEVDNFVREISIDSEATFLDLQNAILDSVNYTKDQMTSFFLCDDDWEKKTEVTLVEMDSSPECDSWIMESTKLSELLEDEKQKLLFIFDYITERTFFMDLYAIQTGTSLDAPICTKQEGDAPIQILSFEDDVIITSVSTDFTSELYSDDEFDMSEIDEESFTNFDESEDPYGKF